MTPLLDPQTGGRARAKLWFGVVLAIALSVSLAVVPLLWVKGLLVVIMVILLTWLMRLPVLEPVAMAK